MASKTSTTSKATTVVNERIRFTITITNNRGKVLVEKDSERKSVKAVHRVARELFADAPVGARMTVTSNGKTVMTWTMHRDGWTFEKDVKAATAALPSQKARKTTAA